MALQGCQPWLGGGHYHVQEGPCGAVRTDRGATQFPLPTSALCSRMVTPRSRRSRKLPVYAAANNGARPPGPAPTNNQEGRADLSGGIDSTPRSWPCVPYPTVMQFDFQPIKRTLFTLRVRNHE